MPTEEMEVLLSGYLDDELTQQQRQRVENLLDRDEEYRRLLIELEQVKHQAEALTYATPSSGEWSRIEKSILQNFSRKLGWMVLWVWASLVSVYAGYEYAMNPNEPVIQKLIVFGLFLGIGLLFVSVWSQRMQESRTDRYKGVWK